MSRSDLRSELVHPSVCATSGAGTMKSEQTLAGYVKNGEGWSSRNAADANNWDRLIKGFAYALPEISDYVRGTFNVQLQTAWIPPDEDQHRAKAHERGMQLGARPEIGADLLRNGNYIHPDILVLSINGQSLDGGRLFFACPTWPVGQGMPFIASRPRIEIISRTAIRSLLGIGPRDEGLDVEVKLRIERQ